MCVAHSRFAFGSCYSISISINNTRPEILSYLIWCNTRTWNEEDMSSVLLLTRRNPIVSNYSLSSSDLNGTKYFVKLSVQKNVTFKLYYFVDVPFIVFAFAKQLFYFPKVLIKYAGKISKKIIRVRRINFELLDFKWMPHNNYIET